MKKILLSILVLSVSIYAQTINKQMSVTIDDLPFNFSNRVSNEEMDKIVTKLINKIKEEKIPATAFVNEGKLVVNGIIDNERITILKKWIDAEIELGNHTYSHRSANQISFEEYTKDVLKGELITNKLLEEKNTRMRFFRHPFLQTGRTIGKRDSITNFLRDHNYEIAPVTIDNSEWVFAAAYWNAVENGKISEAKKVAQEYLIYIRDKIRFYESQSQKLFSRNISHILLIHSNTLNADYFNELCKMIRDEGYHFITLEESLKDEAYKSKDEFTGGAGISWIDRWALTRGENREFFAGEPRTPKYILELAEVEYE